MKFEIVALDDFSGNAATIYSVAIYSVAIDDAEDTLFDQFLEENDALYPEEINQIFETLDQMAHFHGARRQYFKENEGRLGDLVCALYDRPNANLRLYCIRFGATVVVLGGGGPKAKNIKALQEDDKLTQENYLLRTISEQIYKKMKDKEIYWLNDKELGGNLIIDTDE